MVCSRRRWGARLGILFCFFTFAFSGCGDDYIDSAGLVPLSLSSIEPPFGRVLPGSQITIRGAGFIGEPTGSTRVVVEGEMEGEAVLFAVEVIPRSAEELFFALEEKLLSFFPTRTGQFRGTVRAETLTTSGEVEVSNRVTWNIVLVETLEPSMTSLGWLELYPGSVVELEGDGLLLPGEGQSVLLLTGEFTQEAGEVLYLDQVPLVVDAESRTLGLFRIIPEVFGVEPGIFDGAAVLVNNQISGLSKSSESIAFQFKVSAPTVQYVTEEPLRRGQVLKVQGAGFVEPDPELGVGTLLVLDGVFRGSDGFEEDWTGANAKVFFPDTITPNAMEVVVRSVLGLDGKLTGLGGYVGSFDGEVFPWLISGAQGSFGLGLPSRVDLLPQRQVVFVKLLPGFEDALAEFGLHRLSEAVQGRILEVVARDYAGINIEFRFERPEDFLEYTVVELGGFDPNNAGLLGLDNTEGKDVGNLRFNDVIGGFNALSEQQGFYAYGGVFLASFFQFSESHKDSDPVMAHPSFDAVFAPLAPSLGGTPALEQQISRPHVVEALRVLGNLIGNTLSHEVGHALGLANLDGRFHNEGDNENWIMDAGGFRPFDERAELNGMGPEQFSPTNREYLEKILPPDSF